ncbi:restriction endonuclease [Flavitalea flava]
MSKRKYADVPTVDDLYVPTLQALKLLGGSANIQELNEKVYEIMELPEKVLTVPHGDDGRTKVEYRLAWTRTRLKLAGYIENSSRAIWTLNNPVLDINKLTNQKILDQLKFVSKNKKPANTKVLTKIEEDPLIAEEIAEDWKEALLKELYYLLPAAFERLTQRILRESGFIQVEVTGKSGDGGIDGKGIVRINGFLSFHVIFQCKRYKGSVSPSQIRDFRGAMQGRADKGLFLTTGTFTREALKEATRDGAPPIDLIDGELLCDKLKELKLGVKTEMQETVSIEAEWFKRL